LRRIAAGRLGPEERETDDLIEVNVDSIRVHLPTGQHVVILKEKLRIATCRSGSGRSSERDRMKIQACLPSGR